MRDLINSIKAHFYDRATSPLSGAFTISWAIWNYQFLLIIFSGMETIDKMRHISNRLYPDIESILLVGMLFPLITALAYLFVYPYPAKFVYSFVRDRQMELLRIRKDTEDERPLTREDERNIRRDMAELQIQYEKDVERERSENRGLKELVDQLKRDNEGLEQKLDEKSKSQSGHYPEIIGITDDQKKLLTIVSQLTDIPEDTLIRNSQTNADQTRRDIKYLMQMNLAESKDTNDGPIYNLSPLGFGMMLDKIGKAPKQQSDTSVPEGWDFDKDQMSFDVDIENKKVNFFVSREALEDHFNDDDSLTPEQIFDDKRSEIEEIATYLYKSGFFQGKDKNIIKTLNHPSSAK